MLGDQPPNGGRARIAFQIRGSLSPPRSRHRTGRSGMSATIFFALDHERRRRTSSSSNPPRASTQSAECDGRRGTVRVLDRHVQAS